MKDVLAETLPGVIKLVFDLIAKLEQASSDNQPQGGVIIVPASIDIETGLLRIEDVEDDHLR